MGSRLHRLSNADALDTFTLSIGRSEAPPYPQQTIACVLKQAPTACIAVCGCRTGQLEISRCFRVEASGFRASFRVFGRAAARPLDRL